MCTMNSFLPPDSSSSDYSLHLVVLGDDPLFRGSKTSENGIFFRMFHHMPGLITSNIFKDRIFIETF